ncbi:MAG: hypothetical protein B1H03_00040 [Planctomycetales bacterium 4484_113]|nr:MAG: hypothetical protein B1H03_00040 [Planctomycetales bacterium 4484_113]
MPMNWKRRLLALAFSFLGLGIAWLIAAYGLSAFGERWFWSMAFALRGPKVPDSRICIVGIDDASISDLQDAGIPYPFPRSLHGELLRRLADAGAQEVIFDILFSTEPWDESEDQALRDAIRYAQEHGTTVILSALWEVRGKSIQGREVASVATLELPTDTLMEAEPELAIVSALTKLSFKERELAFRDYQGKRYYSQAVQAFRQLLKDEGKLSRFDAAPGEFGISRYHDFLINYYGPSETIRTWQLATLFPDKTAATWEQGSAELPDMSSFKGAIVFVGSVATADNDYFLTPFDRMFGVETNAQALNTLMKHDLIYPVDWRLTIVVLILLALVSWLLAVSLRPLWSMFAFIVLGALFVSLVFLLFTQFNVLMEFTMSSTAFFATFFFSLGFRVLAEESDKRRIRATFGRYMAPDIVKEIIENPQLAVLGGTEREVALLFSDIRNYSTISEPLDPGQTVDFLNRFLTEVSEIIMGNGGFVDKFMGDGVMAVFGAPVPLENPCASAVRAGLQMVEAVYRRSASFTEGIPVSTFRIGVGIHYGTVVMGNVGSGRRMDYTCIGDVVNVASRLESETKAYHTAILVSEEVAQHLGGDFSYSYLDETMVKGRSTPVRIYEVHHPEGPEITDLSSVVKTPRKISAGRGQVSAVRSKQHGSDAKSPAEGTDQTGDGSREAAGAEHDS